MLGTWTWPSLMVAIDDSAPSKLLTNAVSSRMSGPVGACASGSRLSVSCNWSSSAWLRPCLERLERFFFLAASSWMLLVVVEEEEEEEDDDDDDDDGHLPPAGAFSPGAARGWGAEQGRCAGAATLSDMRNVPRVAVPRVGYHNRV